MDYPRFPISEMHLGKFPRLIGISKLESQSTSRLQYVQNQRCLTSPCIGSEKLRYQSQWTIFWHRDRLHGEKISPTTICLMRWLRLYWRSFSRMCTSEKELVSKSSVLRKTSDFYEEGNLPTWSLSIFEPPKLVKLYKVHQIYSIYAYIQNDDVQDFDTRWDQALLAASEIPT